MKLLWLSQEAGLQAQRLDTLLACFDLSSSREELQVVESPFQALCCLLIYLFVQVTSFPVEAAAVTPHSWPSPFVGCGALGCSRGLVPCTISAQCLFCKLQSFEMLGLK